MVSGIDVASYQPDHPAVAGLGFVWIKATEGTTYKNPRLAAQLATARGAGRVVGFYHFLHPGQIKAQVDFFLSTIPEQRGDMLGCDWETPPSGAPASCAEKDDFLHLLKATRVPHKSGLYCNRDFWTTRDTTSFAGDFLWIADPTAAGHPRVTHQWAFHQWGVKGGTDQNIANPSLFPTLAALQQWAGVPVAKPPAAPAPTLDARVSSLEKRVTVLEKR